MIKQILALIGLSMFVACILCRIAGNTDGAKTTLVFGAVLLIVAAILDEWEIRDGA